MVGTCYSLIDLALAAAERQSCTDVFGVGPLIDAIQTYLDSVWWTATTAVVGLAGLLGLILWLIGHRDGWRAWFIPLSLGLLALSVVFSMLFEELIPLWSEVAPRRAIETGLGMFLFGLATVVFAKGGARLVRDTQGALAQPMPRRKKGAGAQAPRWRAIWRPGLRRMGLGVLLFVLGSVLYNQNRFPLDFLARWV